LKVVCEFCGKEFSKYGIQNHIDFIHTKSRINVGNRTKNRKSWNKGLTAKTDERIAKSAEKVSKSTTGRKGRPHTDEAKKKISISKLGNTFATKRIDRQNFYNNFRMDSKWEVAVAIYFDKLKYKLGI